jgi:hypothetical protein
MVLLFVVVVSQDAVGSDPATSLSAEGRPFAFRVEHIPPEEIIQILVPIFPGIHFREDPFLGVITADVTPDRLEPLHQVLEMLDVRRDPAELTIHLVWGKKSSFRGSVPDEIRLVEQELRERFPFGRYEVQSSVFLPVLERGKGKVEVFPDYTLEYAVDRVEPASGEVDVRVDISRLSILGDRLASVLQADLRVYTGQPRVLGGIPVAPDRNAFQGTDQRRFEAVSDRALILVLEVSLTEPIIPTREASLVDRTEG